MSFVNTSSVPFLRHHPLILFLQLSLLLQAVSSSASHGFFPSLQHKSRTHALECRGGGNTASLQSTSNLLSRRGVLPKHHLTTQSSIENVVRRKYQKPCTIMANVEVTHSLSSEPSLEELRAQLGPVALLISNTIELTVITLGSYISGGLLGYFGGGLLNIPSTIFDKSIKGVSKFSALHSKAWSTCKQWGMLSAAFSGFNNAVRMVRGEREDGWNAVWGSALTGAFLNRGGGTQAMIQGAATYAGFTFFLDKFFASPSSHQRQQEAAELMYNDIPLDD